MHEALAPNVSGIPTDLRPICPLPARPACFLLSCCTHLGRPIFMRDIRRRSAVFQDFWTRASGIGYRSTGSCGISAAQDSMLGRRHRDHIARFWLGWSVQRVARGLHTEDEQRYETQEGSMRWSSSVPSCRVEHESCRSPILGLARSAFIAK